MLTACWPVAASATSKISAAASTGSVGVCCLGRDRLYGGPGKDRYYGGKGKDLLYGGPGRDRLYGGPGSDSLSGGKGNDTLSDRDRTHDSIDGGRGADTATVDKGIVDTVRNVETIHA